jgi:hypothetical protein
MKEFSMLGNPNSTFKPRPGGIKGSPMLGNPNSTFKPSNLKHPQRNLHPKRHYTIFRCLVI